MLEYIFFNEKIAQLFIVATTKAQIKSTLSFDDTCYTVAMSEDEDKDTLEQLEDYYDTLFEQDRDLSEAQSDNTEDLHSAGVTVQLSDGRHVYASVPPALLNKLMQCLTSDELNTLICAVSNAVESPDEKALCQRNNAND